MNEQSQYKKTGVDVEKKAVDVFKSTIQNMYPTAFCVIKRDPDFPQYAYVAHTDGAGSKPVQYYLNFRTSGDIRRFRGIAQDVVAMNIDDIACVGARPISFVDYVGINKLIIPKEDFLRTLNDEIASLAQTMRNVGIKLPFDGGETADHPDQLSTLDICGFMQGRAEISNLVTGEKIKPGNVIIGLQSGGQARYEQKDNSGIMCNGITLARHCLISATYSRSYPEIVGRDTSGYYGRFKVDDFIDELGMTIGDAITSPTRIFAPIVYDVLEEERSHVTGLVHNTQGGLTKSLKLGMNVTYIKDNLLQTSPIFNLIQKESKETWKEMFRDFNMGCGFEIITEKDGVEKIISISESYGVNAKVIGQIHKGPQHNRVLIEGPLGKFEYGGS